MSEARQALSFTRCLREATGSTAPAVEQTHLNLSVHRGTSRRLDGNADPDAGGLGWSLRYRISNSLPVLLLPGHTLLDQGTTPQHQVIPLPDKMHTLSWTG